jgi:hypothetical protein
MKLLTPLLAVGLVLIAGCYEEGPLQVNMPDPALEPISPSFNPVMVPFSAEYDETFEQVSFEFPFNNIEISGVGHGTHLGNSTFFGPVQINVTNGAETGTVVFTAADGATLSTAIVGVAVVDGNDISFSGEWTATGGTRRFKNVTGSGTFEGTGTLEPAVGRISFDGEISQPNGRNPQISL